MKNLMMQSDDDTENDENSLPDIWFVRICDFLFVQDVNNLNDRIYEQKHEAWLIDEALYDKWTYEQKHEALLMGEASYDGWTYGQNHEAWLVGEASYDGWIYKQKHKTWLMNEASYN